MVVTRDEIELLVVEDNAADLLLLREAMRAFSAPIRMHVTRDGLDALSFLGREGVYAGVPRPDLILLDLNLPRLDGRELLAQIKQDPRWLRIPVLVFSSSSAPADVARAYELHANCYLVKPGNFKSLEQVTRCIEDFWIKLVRLP